MRTRALILAALGSAALTGCADYGYGYGSGLSVGLGYGGGYGGYYGGYGSYGYSPYGYGGYGYSPYGYNYGGYYGDPYFGWYDNYYYPGTGIYVYDTYRRPHRWSDSQQRYWSQRRNTVLSDSRTRNRNLTDNWSGFDRHSAHDRTHDQTTTQQDRRHRTR
jgi:hypothetical protein